MGKTSVKHLEFVGKSGDIIEAFLWKDDNSGELSVEVDFHGFAQLETTAEVRRVRKFLESCEKRMEKKGRRK